jgi:hypothetical protein
MGVTVHTVKAPFSYEKSTEAPAPRGARTGCGPSPRMDMTAMYRSSVPAYDEGWTRWLFDTKNLQYRSISDKELRAGNTVYKPSAGVTIKLYVILIPDQSATTGICANS